MRDKTDLHRLRPRACCSRSISAFIFRQQPQPQPPAFNPAANPYAQGHLRQRHHRELPDAGREHQHLPRGRRTDHADPGRRGRQSPQGGDAAADDRRLGAAARRPSSSGRRRTPPGALLERAQGRAAAGDLDVAAAQVENARAASKNAQDQLAKQEQSYGIDPKSVSKDALDNARNAQQLAATNLDVVEKQYELTKAGAWIYDIRTRSSNMTRCRRPMRRRQRCLPNTRSGRRSTASCVHPGRRRQLCVGRRAPTTPIRRA